MSALNKAVFLDRDGVLCEDTDYITSFEKLHIYPFAKKAVEQIHKKGYLVIVVTNQSGVARGYLTEEMLQKLNAYLPVSYTHLDVYKRQGFYCGIHNLCFRR